jgi:hypothetical protein
MSMSGILGSLPDLCDQIHRSNAWAGWLEAEPDLRRVGSTHDLVALTAKGGNPLAADQMLGALVRLAAADGGNQQLAVVLLLHLLEPGIRTLARRFRDLDADATALVAGELTVQIRTFPWRRRTRAFAANLLLDVKAVLLRELQVTGPWTRAGLSYDVVLVDPLNSEQVLRLLDRAEPGPGESGELDLADLVLWASRTGVADPADLAMVLEIAGSRDRKPRRVPVVAAAHGIPERTLRHRHGATVARLRSAAHRYLAAAA